MIVYGSSVSPFTRKVLVFAAEKGVATENPPHRPTPPADFAVASPFGKIPAMRDGDFTLADSTAIVAYIDALHPEPNLIPTEARARGRAVWFEEVSDTLLVPSGGKIVFSRLIAPRMGRPPNTEAADKAEHEELPPLYDYLEGQMTASGYLVEDRFTLADICIASPFATLAHVGVGPGADRWPKLAAYLAAILARPSFAALVAGEKATLAGVQPAS